MRVIGADAVAKALRQIPEHLAREKVLPKALTAGANVVKKQAQANIRSQGLVDTGLLVSTLTVRRRSDEVPGQVVVTLKPSNAKVKGQRPIKYAHFSEYGTEREPARPWMRPAADSKGAEAAKVIGEVTLGEVAKQARKLGLTVT